ncbi:zf-HC2 domain-containing protein [candidate division KSB1 bacterium]|nr:zf-HC2 domain-containing protein [candidate division KSB1 bacterium]NIR70479.1 zf-HC2 domain-containing protein [candidate division KSB1 bacterium]NIS27657.1 zf-HC2 domain-containing protein [candidate division KSB1 bacterium]NIT74492.1 zf-HC2 domain-containing protein [candidate division KSB1 bacterium]NIU28338.1 zf-HC2 domain-containing protein [candidate division KSB1 bacterium]
MESCKKFEEKVFDYIEGLLPKESKKEVEGHFEQCQHCSNLLREIRGVKERLHKMRSLKTSPDFETVLRTRISMEKSLRRRSFNGPIGISIYAATGALTVLAAFLLLGTFNGEFRSDVAKETSVVASPNNGTNPNLSNPDIRNSSSKVNFPIDHLSIPSRGTAISSMELERHARSRGDTTRGINAQEVGHVIEF